MSIFLVISGDLILSVSPVPSNSSTGPLKLNEVTDCASAACKSDCLCNASDLHPVENSRMPITIIVQKVFLERILVLVILVLLCGSTCSEDHDDMRRKSLGIGLVMTIIVFFCPIRCHHPCKTAGDVKNFPAWETGRSAGLSKIRALRMKGNSRTIGWPQAVAYFQTKS